MTFDEGSPYVSTREAARILGVAVSTLHRWAQAGRVESVREAGGQRLFRRDVVERLAAEMGRGPGGPQPGDA